MTGKIAPDNARRLTQVHYVHGVVLYPEGYTLPAGDKTPVKVVLDLRRPVLLSRQPELAEQLRDMGFREAVGYDHRDHTRIIGAVPPGNVEELVKGPGPSRQTWPVLIVEVRREDIATPFTPPVSPPKEQSQLLKISRELRLRLGQEADRREQVEVILAWTPRDEDQNISTCSARRCPDSRWRIAWARSSW